MSARPSVKEYPLERMDALLPRPAGDANKYSRGKLTIIGGSAEYPGSVCLGSEAAYRMGTGYVEVLCDARTCSIIQTRTPSVVARDWQALLKDPSCIARSRALVVGPGMTGQERVEQELVLHTLNASEQPILIDGGGITVLASAQGRAAAALRAEKGRALVCTPHFGEATRLAQGARMEVPKAQEGESLAAFAYELSEAYGACVVLKGPETFIASARTEALYSMRLGTPALAKAGTGDVLAGMIGALLAQGLPTVDASCIGSSLHAEAGRFAAAELGEISVMAEDVIGSIPQAIRQIA